MAHLAVAPQMKVVRRSTKAKKAPGVRTVLEELFVLLEDYAPVWYTKKHHDRAMSALGENGVRIATGTRG